jgi:hypothetical protein
VNVRISIWKGREKTCYKYEGNCRINFQSWIQIRIHLCCIYLDQDLHWLYKVNADPKHFSMLSFFLPFRCCSILLMLSCPTPLRISHPLDQCFGSAFIHVTTVQNTLSNKINTSYYTVLYVHCTVYYFYTQISCLNLKYS